MGIIDMDSVPPATITSAPPLIMRSAAMAIDCSPEEQKRLMVSAETSTGNPARREAMRATFMPCSASGMAQPMMTSSISLGSSCGTLASAPLMATAASSSGRVARSVPLKARPTGVRTDEAIMTSRMDLYRDVFRGGAGRRNWFAVLTHAFEVELHRFTNEFFHFVQRSASNAEAGKIGCISSPTFRGLLIDDEIFHFNPACLRILFNVPGGMSTDDVLQQSPFRVLSDDDIAGGCLSFGP